MTQGDASQGPHAPHSPLLSVIVPTFRSAKVIDGLLASLAAQTWRGFELIISDGASDDATLAQVREQAPRLPSCVIDSRPDRGVYDAINRGVALASAPWFLVMGSDDVLHAANTLEQAAPVLAQCLHAQTPELVYGDVRMMAANLHGVPAGGRYAGELSLSELPSSNICQQAIFYRRSLHQALGGFDLRYPLYADWAFNLQAAFRSPLRWIDLVVADYSSSGLSTGQYDEAFIHDCPSLVRQAFLAHADSPRVRAARHRLLRDANWLRRHGRWREAAANLAIWWRLR